MLEVMYYGPVCPFWKPAFIVFISSLYLYFGFSNKHFSIQFIFQYYLTRSCINLTLYLQIYAYVAVDIFL